MCGLRPSSATRWVSVVVAVVAPPDQDTDGHKPQTKTKTRCKALIAPLTSFAFAPFPRFNRSVEVLPRRRMGRPGSVPDALLSPTSFGRRIPTTAGPGPAAHPVAARRRGLAHCPLRVVVCHDLTRGMGPGLRLGLHVVGGGRPLGRRRPNSFEVTDRSV